MEPQTPTTPEQPSMAPQQDMSAPASMPASQEPMTPTPASQPVAGAPVASAPANAQDPGHGLAIVGLVLAFFAPLIGLILSVIAKSKSKKAGMKNGLATAGIVVSSVIMVIVMGIFTAAIISGFNAAKECADNAVTTTNSLGETVLTCN